MARDNTYNSMSRDPAERAKALLTHYFKTVFVAAGIEWADDNESEVAQIVDDIEEANVNALKVSYTTSPQEVVAREWLDLEIARIENDERYIAPRAHLNTNAPLALIQCALNERRSALRQVRELLKGGK